MNYDNYYKNGGMTKEESISAIALRIGARKEAVAKFVEENDIDTNKMNSDLKSGKVYFMDIITAIVGKPNNKYQKEIIKKYGSKMAMGGKTQGYDDREDERLGMDYGKIAGKDFVGSHSRMEHSRRDDARFEERMARGGKIYEKEKLSNINYQLQNTEESFQKNNPEAYSRMKDEYKAQFIKVYGKDEYAKRHMMADGGMMAEGGEVYYVRDFYPNYDEDKIVSILKSNGLRKVRKAKLYGMSNLPQVAVFEGDKNKAQEILEKEFPDNYISIYEKDWGRKMADGGHIVEHDKMYNFLQDDLEKLQTAIEEGDTEEVSKFFSYWNQHLQSLKMGDGGMMADGGEVFYVRDFYPNYDEDKIVSILKSNGLKKVRKAKLYGMSNLPQVAVFEGDKNKAQEILEKEFPDNYISIYEKDWGRKMADGGETERDTNGMLYALQEHVSSGEIASKTNASKYADIDEIRSKAIQYYMENGDKPYSYAELESVLKKFDHTKYAKGGRVYKDWTGSNSKENWGQENLYPKYNNPLHLIADVSDYYKELSKDVSENFSNEQKNDMIEVLKTGKKTFNDGATLKFANGGRIQEEDDYLLGYEPYFEKNVPIASIDRENKIVRPTSGYFPKHPMSKKAINWAKKHGYDYIADGKKYDDGGETERKAEALKTAVEIATMAYNNGVRASDMSFEDFSDRIFGLSNTSYPIVDLRLAYQSMKNANYAEGGYIDEDGLHELARLVMDSIDYTVNISLDEFIKEVSMTGYQRELCMYVLNMFNEYENPKPRLGEVEEFRLVREGMFEYIKNYYLNEYPTDDLGADINPKADFDGLLMVLNEGDDVYEYLGVSDSLVRERVFEKLANIMGIEYNVIYDMWLSSDDKFKQGGYMADGGEVYVVLNEGYGKIINKLYNDWNNVKTEKEYKKWVEQVRSTKFGTYGTLTYEQVLKNFDFDNAPINSFHLKTFKSELKNALEKGYKYAGIMANGGKIAKDDVKDKIYFMYQKFKLGMGDVFATILPENPNGGKIKYGLHIRDVVNNPSRTQKYNTQIFELDSPYYPDPNGGIRYAINHPYDDDKFKAIGMGNHLLVVELPSKGRRGLSDLIYDILYNQKNYDINNVNSQDKNILPNGYPNFFLNDLFVFKGDMFNLMRLMDRIQSEFKYKGNKLYKDKTPYKMTIIWNIPELKNYDNKITTPATYIPILEIENELEGNSKKFELGGAIENQYEGRTAKDIWESWNQEQKIHFFIDHKEHPYYNMGREEFVVSKNDREKYVGMSYDDLPKTVKLMISDHVEEGQYANGGMMADGGFVVVSENDGYWYIMSKPTSKQDAEEFLNTLTIPRGEVGKVVSVEDAKNHKKVIGRKYLKMADGGVLKEDDYVWNAVGKKLVVNKVTDDEYFLSAFGQIGDSPFSKEKVEMYLKNGQWSRKPKMAKGGAISEQNEMNKKVLSLVRKANIDSKLEFGQLVVSALTDANAHSQVRKFISIIEKKPEWAEKPKEIDMKLPREEFQKQRAKTVYGSKYYDANEKIEDLGVEIANMSGWGFEVIVDSLIFASKMSGRNDVAEVLEKLNTDDDKQDATKNKWDYTDVDDIEYVVVKDKSGKELKFAGKHVLSGVHDLLEKGGKLSEKGKYYSKDNVVSVVVGGKNIINKNTVSGVWIMKDAKPIADDVADMKIGKTTIRKGFNGWVGKTMVDNFKGFDWDITTIKTSRGDLVTTAQGGKSQDNDGYKSFSFMMFQDPNIRLKVSRPARVTDKVVSAQHEEALKEFKERQEEIAEMVDQIQAKKKMADGGAIGFDALAKKVAKNYEGDDVKKEFQKEYGKTYDKKEAEEVGKKVAAKVYRQQKAKGKMAKGGETSNYRNNSKLARISAKAKEIRKANEPWRDAFKRAKAMIG